MPPVELIDIIRHASAVFIKSDGYVPAHLNANEGETLEAHWTVERLTQYLIAEAALATDKRKLGETASIFIGDAKYHYWIHHYLVAYDNRTGRFTWSRVK